MSLVVDGPHTIWADVGGGNGRKDIAAIARLGVASTALSYKISEGRSYLDPNGQWHHDQAMEHGMFPLPYVFPLPPECGMSIPDQAKRDADLIHDHHGSFEGIGAMLDCEREPGFVGWGPFMLTSAQATQYVSTFRSLTGISPPGGYEGAGYVASGKEGFGWRVIPNYSYGGPGRPLQSLDAILRTLNGGVTWMPPGGAFRQFTDAVNISGSPTDFNIAPIPPAQFLELVGGSQEDGMPLSDADIKKIVDGVNAHTNVATLIAVGAAVGQEQNKDGSFPYTLKGLKLQTDNQQAALNKAFADLPDKVAAAVVAHIPAAGGVDEATLEAVIAKVIREQLGDLEIGLKA
jgi:hypothetical protein